MQAQGIAHRHQLQHGGFQAEHGLCGARGSSPGCNGHARPVNRYVSFLCACLYVLTQLHGAEKYEYKEEDIVLMVDMEGVDPRRKPTRKNMVRPLSSTSYIARVHGVHADARDPCAREGCPARGPLRVPMSVSIRRALPWCRVLTCGIQSPGTRIRSHAETIRRMTASTKVRSAWDVSQSPAHYNGPKCCCPWTSMARARTVLSSTT